MNGFSAPIKETPESFHPVRTSKKTASEPGRGPSLDTKPANALNSDFPVPEVGLCSLPSLRSPEDGTLNVLGNHIR